MAVCACSAWLAWFLAAFLGKHQKYYSMFKRSFFAVLEFAFDYYKKFQVLVQISKFLRASNSRAGPFLITGFAERSCCFFENVLFYAARVRVE